MARTRQPQRRPVDFTALESIVARMKLRTGIELPTGRARNVTVPRDAFVPVVQAPVGSSSSVTVYRYRMLVPMSHVIEDSATTSHSVRIATDEDLDTIGQALTRHFGGVTVLHQQPASAVGMGARDPDDVAGTTEKNLHVAFEVYAAPVQESDDYFRALRHELGDALLEGVILIERQEVTLI
jgi:hypothetical protein